MKTTAILSALLLAFSLQAQVYQLSDVDTAPVFAKGKLSSDAFMSYYLQYPLSEYESGVEGTVMLEYIVDSAGMVNDVKVATGVSQKLDKEAVRVASLFPFYSPATKDGKNVAVKLQLPVVFKIADSANVVANNTPKTDTASISDDGVKNPLYVVNNKILDADTNIDPSAIKKIRVIKGKKAIDLYGERAKDGVILIETD